MHDDAEMSTNQTGLNLGRYQPDSMQQQQDSCIRGTVVLVLLVSLGLF